MRGPTTISDLAALSPTGWSICDCGHRGEFTLSAVAARHPGASIAAVRRAMRCQACRYRSRPMIGVTLSPATSRRPHLQLVDHTYKPQKRLDFIGLAFAEAARQILDKFAETDPEAHAKLTADPDKPFAVREKWLD